VKLSAGHDDVGEARGDRQVLAWHRQQVITDSSGQGFYIAV